MNYKYMRVLVMFDLPVVTQENLKNYRQFRKYLIKNGFIMLQESVYFKLTPNGVACDNVVNGIKKNKPPVRLVQVLRVTEKQFQKMEYVVGKKKNEIIDSDERVITINGYSVGYKGTLSMDDLYLSIMNKWDNRQQNPVLYSTIESVNIIPSK